MTRRWAEESIYAMETLEKAGGSINDTEVRILYILHNSKN